MTLATRSNGRLSTTGPTPDAPETRQALTRRPLQETASNSLGADAQVHADAKGLLAGSRPAQVAVRADAEAREPAGTDLATCTRTTTRLCRETTREALAPWISNNLAGSEVDSRRPRRRRSSSPERRGRFFARIGDESQAAYRLDRRASRHSPIPRNTPLGKPDTPTAAPYCLTTASARRLRASIDLRSAAKSGSATSASTSLIISTASEMAAESPNFSARACPMSARVR